MPDWLSKSCPQASHNKAAYHHLSKSISSHNKQVPSFTTMTKTCQFVPSVFISSIGQDLAAPQAAINVKSANSMTISQVSVLALTRRCKLIYTW